jgi:hypothetical protein
MAAAGLIIELSSNNRREKPYLYQIKYEIQFQICIVFTGNKNVDI